MKEDNSIYLKDFFKLIFDTFKEIVKTFKVIE